MIKGWYKKIDEINTGKNLEKGGQKENRWKKLINKTYAKKMSKIHKSVYPCANQPKSGGIYQSAFIRQKLTPWNVDTISHDKFAKTIINKEVPKRRDEDMSEEERAERYKNFLGKYKEKIKHFGMLKHYEDSKTFLLESPDLVCDDTANYLVVWCIDLEIEEVTIKLDNKESGFLGFSREMLTFFKRSNYKFVEFKIFESQFFQDLYFL